MVVERGGEQCRTIMRAGRFACSREYQRIDPHRAINKFVDLMHYSAATVLGYRSFLSLLLTFFYGLTRVHHS